MFYVATAYIFLFLIRIPLHGIYRTGFFKHSLMDIGIIPSLGADTNKTAVNIPVKNVIDKESIKKCKNKVCIPKDSYCSHFSTEVALAKVTCELVIGKSR